jgi:2,5-diamino-6-(ribosylamino)-4(3H)-pyrimidinone 5'-phosphate reductase
VLYVELSPRSQVGCHGAGPRVWYNIMVAPRPYEPREEGVPIDRLFDSGASPALPRDLYEAPDLSLAPPGRPLIYTNMVCTVDGKTLQAARGSTAHGLGSPTDQILMRRLQSAADGIMIGAGTLRAGPVIYARGKWRVVVTGSGDVPVENRFFTDAPDQAIVLTTGAISREARERLSGTAHIHVIGITQVDVAAAASLLRHEYGVERLLVEGGADLNAAFFEAGLVDEVFLTVAPKVKGGASLPTMVDGAGLPGREFVALDLRSVYRDGDELYLHYRVRRIG